MNYPSLRALPASAFRWPSTTTRTTTEAERWRTPVTSHGTLTTLMVIQVRLLAGTKSATHNGRGCVSLQAPQANLCIMWKLVNGTPRPSNNAEDFTQRRIELDGNPYDCTAQFANVTLGLQRLFVNSQAPGQIAPSSLSIARNDARVLHVTPAKRKMYWNQAGGTNAQRIFHSLPSS